jgi:pyruvate formate lyase activating enzyme
MRDTHPWQTRLEGGRVRCELCPRECTLHEGQRGFCFVRAHDGDGIELVSYGRSTGFCIDPIEKKPLSHFLPGTPVLSFGTAGCNLGCKFCQNWTISKSREVADLSTRATPAAIAKAASSEGCRSVAFTYNDPVIWAEYAIDTAIECHALGLATVAVSAGYISKSARHDFFSHIDAVNIDLKAFSEDFYQRLCAGSLAPVLDTLRYLRDQRGDATWTEITTLVIPGENDDQDELRRLSAWICEVMGPDTPLHLSAFHPDFKLSHIPRTPLTTLQSARQLAISEGLRYVYTGNVHDVEGDTTYCPGCNAAVIVRDWYQLELWNLDEGKCGNCGQLIPGVFEGQPGRWGRKRLPISP